MTTRELRRAAKASIDALPPEQLKVAAEFLNYLRDRVSEEATAELMKIPGLLEDLQEANEAFQAGEGTPVSKLQRKYERDV